MSPILMLALWLIADVLLLVIWIACASVADRRRLRAEAQLAALDRLMSEPVALGSPEGARRSLAVPTQTAAASGREPGAAA